MAGLKQVVLSNFSMVLKQSENCFSAELVTQSWSLNRGCWEMQRLAIGEKERKQCTDQRAWLLWGQGGRYSDGKKTRERQSGKPGQKWTRKERLATADLEII